MATVINHLPDRPPNDATVTRWTRCSVQERQAACRVRLINQKTGKMCAEKRGMIVGRSVQLYSVQRAGAEWSRSSHAIKYTCAAYTVCTAVFLRRHHPAGRWKAQACSVRRRAEHRGRRKSARLGVWRIPYRTTHHLPRHQLGFCTHAQSMPNHRSATFSHQQFARGQTAQVAARHPCRYDIHTRCTLPLLNEVNAARQIGCLATISM